MTEILFTRRNVPECMGMAWSLMSTNIARMSKALWLPAVVLAVLCAATATWQVLGGIFTTAGISLWYVVGLFAATLLIVLASVFLDAKIFKLLNLQTVGFCFARAVKAFCIHLALTLIALVVVWGIATSDVLLASSGTLSAPLSMLLFLGEMVVVAILLLAVFSPVIFALTKYMVEPQTKLRLIWQDYRRGLRSVGFIVAFYLLCAVVLIITYLIIALPAVIATGAAAMSDAGVATGDPSGLPAHFGVLYALTIFITTFVAIVLRVWSLFATYYMYASIEAKNGRTDDTDGSEAAA